MKGEHHPAPFDLVVGIDFHVHTLREKAEKCNPPRNPQGGEVGRCGKKVWHKNYTAMSKPFPCQYLWLSLREELEGAYSLSLSHKHSVHESIFQFFSSTTSSSSSNIEEPAFCRSHQSQPRPRVLNGRPLHCSINNLVSYAHF